MAIKRKIKGLEVSVVLPSYNERENIGEAIKRISSSLGKDLLEIIVVDDNSPDGTWKIVRDMKNPKYRVIRRINERGLASALALGVEKAKGNVVAWMDCDLGVPPEVIPLLVEKLDKYDVVIASRYAKGGKDLRPRIRAFFSVFVNLFAGLLLGPEVRDYTSGVIAIKSHVLSKIKLSKDGFGEYFIEFVHSCVKNNFKVTEVGYHYRNRKGGVSKSDGNALRLLKFGIQYGIKIIKLKFISALA